METAVYKSPIETIQDGNLDINSKTEGVDSEKMFFQQNLIKNNNEQIDSKLIEKENYNIIGGSEHSKEISCNGTAGNATEGVPEKILSPTLIEHAFKVVKNLFSPDKNRSKSHSIINQQRSSSGSPRSSIYIPNKPDLLNLQETDIVSQVACSTPTDDNLKGENFSVNPLGSLPMSFNFESHNNTDDSFLTSVSLIDESFQSAVTHLDENGETLKNGNVQQENIFGDFQNLDLVNISSNDTINSSELDLENTMLKTSLTNMEDALQNISNNKSNVLNDSVTPNSKESEKCEDVKYVFNCKKPNDSITCETVKENLEQNCQQPYETKDVEEIIQNCELLPKCETMPSEKIILSNRENVNFTTTYFEKEISISKSDSFSKVCDLKSDVKRETNQPNDVEHATEEESKKHSDKNIEELISYNIKNSITNLDAVDEKLEPCAIISETNFSKKEEKLIGINEAEAENCSLEAKYVENNNVISLKEKDIELVNSISTTTVVLSESDSILDFHESLKENFLGPEAIVKKENETVPIIISKCVASNDLTSTKNKKMLNQIDNKQQKRLIKSETNTPNKTNNLNKNKLNKSADFAVTKNFCKSPRRRKTLAQKQEESAFKELDVANEKANHRPVQTSDFEEKNENNLLNSQDSHGIVSQQSYTVLNTIDNNLQRPIILSPEDLSDGSCKSKLEEWNLNLSKEIDNEKIACSDNEHSDLSAENISKISTVKSSTPICGSAGSAKKRTQSENKKLEAKILNLTSTAEEAHCNINSENPNLLDEKLQTAEINEPIKVSFEINNGTRTEISPVTTDVERQFVLPDSSEKEKSSLNGFNLNNTWVKTEKILNSTYDKKSEFAGHQLNQTYDKNLVAEKIVILPEVKTLDQTFDVKVDGIMNQTYDKNLIKLNTTYDKKSEVLNQTFEMPLESTNKLNQTFEKKSSVHDGLNQTYSKNMENIDEAIVGDEKCKTTSSNKISVENIIEAKACPTTIIEKPLIKSELPVIFDEGTGDNKEILNASTNSSNASLFLNTNATIVLNPENVLNGGDDLSSTTSKETFQNNWKKEVKESSTDSNKSNTSDDFQIQNHSIFVNKQLPASPKYDKVHCDLELVQLIQEQFSSTDIEKICSVVDDMSIKKLSNQIQKASEQYVKSFHEHSPNGDLKTPKDEKLSEKFINPLTPQGFEFLNSIQGKPTGRDLSRESLYVKFDPLVQPPNINSLIDFTKEVESVSTFECIPENLALGNKDACEHLLTISPEKKPDDIVPPLTPLSERGKKFLRDDEKLKDLQNEIYFLKNLYAERERSHKAKMEEFESQITKLTGQNCILEDMIKASNEREKSLARKVKEQNQNLGQLSVIMEEYTRVITKLTSELEDLKKENKNQLESLASEKDSYMIHLQNTEAAFSDVHAKYEKSKKTIMSLKSNETMFRKTIAEQNQKLEEYKERAKSIQENACREFEKMQEELTETRANHNQEATRLRAQLRKTELKLEAIQESLDQKVKENEQLTAICDELIEGKK